MIQRVGAGIARLAPGALELGGSAHVHGAEHFMEAFHDFSCTAATVRHPVTREVLGVLGLATDTTVSACLARSLIVRVALDAERLLENQVFGRERELLERYLRDRAGHQAPFLTVDRGGHTVIQNARMLQRASGEDVARLLSVARHALNAAQDIEEEVELSRGRSTAAVRLVRTGSEVLGALVSLQRPARRRTALGDGIDPDFSSLVGRSAPMLKLFREASKVARRRADVVICGEPGTGKRSLAELLHRAGSGGRLTIVHCAGGHWADEWDGAVGSSGTIILSRIHSLSAADQLALCDRLDAIDHTEGAHWVISLLNARGDPPCAELESRLAQVTLAIPALRDRGHDLRLLVDAWCDERERSQGRRPIVRPEAHDALAAQPWPGNVRELHNVLEGALLRGGSVVGVDALALEPPSPGAPHRPAGSLREAEREAISSALARNGGNVSRAARELGIGRATLHRRLRAYRLLNPPPGAPGADPPGPVDDPPA